MTKKLENNMQNSTQDTFRTTVKIERRSDLEPALNHAVAEAIRCAIAQPGNGIRVTRHNYETFTIELTKDVRPGLIVEISA